MPLFEEVVNESSEVHIEVQEPRNPSYKQLGESDVLTVDRKSKSLSKSEVSLEIMTPGTSPTKNEEEKSEGSPVRKKKKKRIKVRPKTKPQTQPLHWMTSDFSLDRAFSILEQSHSKRKILTKKRRPQQPYPSVQKRE